MQADGGRVCDVHADIKGQFLHQHGGSKAVTVQNAHKADDHRCQARHRKQERQKLIRKSRRLVAAVCRDGGFHPVPHVIERIRQVKLDLDHRLALVRIRGILQDGKRRRAVVPGKELLVHDEAVYFRVAADGAHISGDNDLHIGDFLVFLRLLPADIPRQQLQICSVLQKHLRVAAHRHHIGGNPHDRVDSLYPSAVRSPAKHFVPSFLFPESRPGIPIKTDLRGNSFF